MAIYLPTNRYSTLMYGSGLPSYGTGSSTSSSSGRLPRRSSWDTDTSNSNIVVNTPVIDTRDIRGGANNNMSGVDESKDNGESMRAPGTVSGAFNDAWSRDALRSFGLESLRDVGVISGAAGLAGLSLADAVGLGLEAGLNPVSSFGRLGGLLANSIGVESPMGASTVGSVLGGILGGPIGSVFGSAVAPFGYDAIADLANARSYENVRDLAEDLSDGYAAGRTAGTAYSRTMDALSKTGLEDSLGLGTAARAAAYAATNYGMNPDAYSDIAVDALARRDFERRGYYGWENQALLDQALAPEQAFNEALAMATALNTAAVVPNAVQQAAQAPVEGVVTDPGIALGLGVTSLGATENYNRDISAPKSVAQDAVNTASDIASASTSNSSSSSSSDKSGTFSGINGKIKDTSNINTGTSDSSSSSGKSNSSSSGKNKGSGNSGGGSGGSGSSGGSSGGGKGGSSGGKSKN